MKIAQFGVALASVTLVMVALPVAHSAEFPASFLVPTAQELSTHVAGKTARGIYANGTPVQSVYSPDGTLTATAPGFNETGRWRSEDGKICGSLPKIGDFCNDARFDAGVLHLRRTNGEIVRYDVK